MVNIKFDGDVSQISERQLEYISEVLENNGYGDAKVTINAVGEAGDNYVANVKRVVAEKDGKTFKMIVKVAPNIELLRVTMNTRTLFCNEHVMYTEVLPKYTELEKAAGIPEEQRLKYATCYGTLLEDCNELIILEDLKETNYVMLDRFKSLTDNEVKLVLKSFARLHSLSYALKNTEPDTYNKLVNSLSDVWENFSREETMKQYFEVSENDCISLLEDVKYKNAIKGTMSRFLDIGAKLHKYDSTSRYSVIQQGDSWTNNIMFQLEEGKAVSCCMIDYQISRVNSPVADIYYMIFNCTDHATRKQYFYDWLDYYHSELDKSLFEFGLKVNYVYPRDQLDADFKRHGRMALSISVLLASTICRESSEAANLKTAMENTNDSNMEEMYEATKLSTLTDKTLTIFRAKIEGLVDSFIEFGLM